MRVAIAGKGGVGKTTIAATLTRLLARSGREVVAIDADSSPNLATALGIRPDVADRATALPASLVSRRLAGPRLTQPLAEVLDRFGIRGPDGVKLLVVGAPAHAAEGCLCSKHAAVSAVLADLGERHGHITVTDMEASPEHLARGTAREVDVLLLVAEPYYRSLQAVRLLAGLARELPIPRVAVVANKLRSPADADAVAAFCERHGLEKLADLPWSRPVVDADALGTAAVDQLPDAFLTAVANLAELLLAQERVTSH